ncbi:hypothetical protein ACLGIH_12210 [Streptomyces sp. HMX87]|uniref:hypothetical protein n=1 Tax=Streptomyces sp. HMX87 TaxID=3390849 RepID=UPI003A85E2D5
MTTTDTPATPQRPRGPRGRHRRPRPRKVLVAVGALTLAAGALSLVRPAPDADPGGFDAAEAGPRAGGGLAAERTATATAGPPTVPGPSATSVMGALSTPAATGSVLVPAPAPAPTSATGTWRPTVPSARRPATSVPDAPNSPDRPRPPGTRPAPGQNPPPAATPTPRPPENERPAPPSRGTPPSTPDRTPEPDRPGLCVPVIGLCVDLPG